MTMCIILSDADRQEVETDVAVGDLYATYGPQKGYQNDSELHPVRRAGGGTNPDPCFILNAAVLSNDDFATAQPYLSGLSQKDSNDATFPGVYVPPGP